MTCTLTRTAALVGLLTLAAGPLVAQQREASADLPPHVRAQLWPTRPLSPAEQELKDRVIVLRDSVAVLDGSVALLQRQQRGNAASGVLRSSGRRIATNCAAGHRAAEVMEAYARDLTTDNARWGETAVRTFRDGVGQLVRETAACERTLGEVLAADGAPDPERLAAVARAVERSTAIYTNAVNGLLNTLEIRIDPRGTGRS